MVNLGTRLERHCAALQALPCAACSKFSKNTFGCVIRISDEEKVMRWQRDGHDSVGNVQRRASCPRHTHEVLQRHKCQKSACPSSILGHSGNLHQPGCPHANRRVTHLRRLDGGGRSVRGTSGAVALVAEQRALAALRLELLRLVAGRRWGRRPPCVPVPQSTLELESTSHPCAAWHDEQEAGRGITWR